MPGSYYAQLPAYNPGPGINWGPLNDALDSWTQQNNRNALIALQNKEFDANQKQREFDNARTMRQDHYALIERGARQANAISLMPAGSPEQKAAWAAHIADHRRNFPDEEITPEELDPITGPKIYATAAGLALESPGAVALRDAQIAQAKASTAKSYEEVAASRRQSNLVRSLMPEYFGDQPSQPGPQPTNALVPPAYYGAQNADQPVNALVPTQGAIAAPEPRNALMDYGVPADAFAEPTNSVLLPGISGQAARAVSTSRSVPPPVNALRGPAQGGDTRPVAGVSVSQPSQSPSTSLPAPGDPTSFTGDSASGMTTPSRISPDTRRAMAYDLALNGGKGMSSILNNDPGSKYATAYAAKTAEDSAGLNLKQKMTKPLLAQVQHMRQLAIDAGEDVLTKATGPDYSEGQEGSWLPGFVHPDTSGQPYQNVRAIAQHLNPFSNQKSYDDAARLNLQMQHIKKMLGASVKALPGTKGGGVSTDQDQALVLDAVGEALHAQDPETFFKILYDAENGLRARAGMPPLKEPTSYLPPSWQKPGQKGQGSASAPPNAAVATAIAGGRDAIKRGADPAAVRQRLIQNGINPDGL